MQKNLDTVGASEGTLAKQQEIYAESWEGARDRVRAAAEDIYDSLINEDFFIGLDNAITPFLSLLARLIDGFGGLDGILSGIFLLVNKIYGDRIAQSMRDFAANIGIVSQKEAERARALQAEAVALIENMQLSSATLGERRNLEILKEEVGLRGQINKIYDRLSPAQKEIIDNELYKIQLLKEQANTANEAYSKAEQAYKASMNKMTHGSRSVDNTVIGQVRSEIAAWNAGASEKDKIKLDFNVDLKGVKQQISNQITSLNQEISKNQGTYDAYKQLDKSAANYQERLKQLYIAELNNGQNTTKTAQQMELAFENVGQQVENTKAKVEALNNAGATANTTWQKLADDAIKAYNDKYKKQQYMQIQVQIRKNANFDKSVKDIQKEIDNTLSLMNENRNKANFFKQFVEDAKKSEIPLDKLKKTLKDLGTTTGKNASTEEGLFGALEKEANKLLGQTDNLKNKLLGFKDVLTQMGFDDTSAEALTQDLVKMYEAGASSEDILKRLHQEIARFRGMKIDNPIDWADTLVKAGTTISQVSMGLNAMNNITKTLFVEGVDSVEDFTSVLMSLGMVIPVIASMISAGKKNNAGAALSYLFLGASAKTAEKGIEGVGMAINAAMPYIGLIVMAIGALVAILSALLPTSEKSREKIKESTEAFEEQKNALESLNNELKTTQDRIKELSEQPSLSFVEQDELDRLLLQEASLERQLATQEQLAKLAQQEQARTIKKEWNSAVGDLTEGPDLRKTKAVGVRLSSNDKAQLDWYKKVLAGEAEGDREVAEEKVRELQQYGATGYTTADEWFAAVTEGLDPSLDLYKEYEAEYQDWIRENDQKVADWSDENAEAIIAAEDNYLSYLQAVQSGAVVRDDDFIAQQQADLAAMRRLYYGGEGAYQEKVIDPAASKSENFGLSREELLDAATEGNEKALSENYKQYLEMQGISIEEFFESLAKRVDDGTNKLKEAGLKEEEIKKLSNEDLEIASHLNLDGIDNIDELQDAIEKYKAEIAVNAPNAFLQGVKAFQAKYGEIHKIIDGLNQGDTISAEDYAKLDEASKAYFTKMLDGTYMLTQNADELKEATQDDLMEEAKAELKGLEDSREQAILGYNTKIAEAEAKIAEFRDNNWQDIQHQDPRALQEEARLLSELNAAYKEKGEGLDKIDTEIAEQQRAIAFAYDTVSALKQAYDEGEISADDYAAALQHLNDEMLKEYGISPEEFETYVDLLMQSETHLKGNRTAAEQVARAQIKLNKGLKDISENWEDWNDVMTDSESSLEEQSKVLTAIKKPLQDVLNLDADEFSLLPDDFAQEHWGLIQDVMNGVEGAIDRLKAEAAEDILIKVAPEVDMNKDGELDAAFQQLHDEIASYDKEQFEVGVAINKQQHQAFIAACNDIIAKAGMTAEEATSYFKELGYDVEIKEKYIPGKVTWGSEEYLVPGETRPRKQMLKKVGYGQWVNTIKTITPDGSSGGDFNFSSSGGGGGGSSKPSTIDSAKSDLRYRKIDRSIDSTSRSLDKLDTQVDRTFGLDKIPLLNKGLEELNKQAGQYGQRLNEANGYLEEDLAAIRELGLTPIIDAAGEITNYDELVKAIDAAYNAEVEKYNAMPAAQQEQHKERMDQLKEEHEKQKEALDQYIKTLDERNDTQDKIDETRRKAWDMSLEIATKELEITLKIKDLRQDIRDINKEISESFGDYLDHGGKILELEEARYEEAMGLKETLESTVENIMAISADPYADTEALVESLTEVSDEAIASAQDLLKFLDVIKTHLPNAVEAARERLDYFFETFDHHESVAESVKELMALQGASYKTADGLAKLQKATAAQMQNQEATLAYNKQWYEALLPLVAEAEAELAKHERGTAGYDIAKAARDALTAEMREAESAMLESAQAAMETARVMYETEVDALLYSLEQKLTDGVGFELLQAKYDHLISANDRYLDEVNKIYQVEDLNRKIQADIDKSQGQYSTNRLKALQDELALLNKRNNVSAYELEIMNAKYAMLQAQIALEEAQNAKSQVRLMRDSNGNWNYQFTADQDAINTAQANYDKAVNDYYNIAKEYAESTSAEILSLQQEMMDELREIWTNEELTEEERRARMLEVQEYYREQAGYLYEELKKAVQDTGEAGKLAIEDFDNMFTMSLSEMVGSFETFEAGVSEATPNIVAAFDKYQAKIAEIAKTAGVDLDSLSTKISEVATATDKAKEGVEAAIDSIEGKLPAIQAATNYWAKFAETIRDSANAYAEFAEKTTGTAASLETPTPSTPSNQAPSGNGKGFVEGADYQALINTHLANGGSTEDETYKMLIEQRQKKIDMLKSQGYDESYWATNAGTILSQEEYNKWIKLVQALGFDTGGYTGSWGGYGKLAFLHEKELVLNKEDTANILSAVGMIRDIGPALFQSIAQMLDKEAAASQFLMGARLSAPNAAAANEKLVQQIVSIDANFPGVQAAAEIEFALNNLVNSAAQRASINFK